MLKKLVGLLVALMVAAVAATAAALAVLMVGMRTKSPKVLTAVRRMNRTVTNPRVMATAGTADSTTAVVRHVGRTSGRSYETPIDAVPTDDGFVVAMPYGTQADWVRNVLTAGHAVIVRGGVEHAVVDPEVVPVSAMAEHFPPDSRRMLRLFGVDECLRLRRATEASPA